MKTRLRYKDAYSPFLGVECAWPVPDHRSPYAHSRAAQARPRARRWIAALALVIGLIGLSQVGHAGYIHAKAWLAQVLISQAWERTLAGETQVKPWPWADTWPVARLRAPRQGIERFVLAGANGRSIAFGPGHLFGTAQPGMPGNSVIGAHRDTHFAFLQWLKNGDEIEVEIPSGRVQVYRVSGHEVVEKTATRVLAAHPGEPRLTLITCYPFDALRAGGPLRYVVTATVSEGRRFEQAAVSSRQTPRT